MRDQPMLVLLVAAVLLVVLATLAVLGRALRPVTSVDPRPAPAPAPGADGVGRLLARGFSHLFSPLGLPRRRNDLSDRLDRALRRIDQVDPYANHRRIGLALLTDRSTEALEQGGTAPTVRPTRGSTLWPPLGGPADPREIER